MPYQRPLTETEYDEIVQAKSVLSALISIESLYVRVLLAFEDFELFSFQNAMNGYLFHRGGYSEFYDARIRASLKAVNFLNALASFRDQFPKTKNFYFNLTCRDRVWADWRALCETSVEFSFCCRLRNFAQHYSEPIEYSSQYINAVDDTEKRETTWGWHADVEAVCNFKRGIKSSDSRRYKDAFGRKCDVSLLFRSVVSELGELHRKVRRSLDADFSTARELMLGVLSSMPSEGGRVPSGRVQSFVGGDEVCSIDVFPEFVERAHALRASKIILNAQNHYVSNRSKGHL